MLYNGEENIPEDVDFVEIRNLITKSAEANFWKNIGNSPSVYLQDLNLKLY